MINKKLHHYGFRGNALPWFSDFLEKRTHYVSLNYINSVVLSVKCVTQGSIMGPLPFILFINDIVNTSNLTKFIVYADDINSLVSYTNLTKLYEKVNIELTKILNDLK